MENGKNLCCCRNVEAAFLNSSLSSEAFRDTCQAIRRNVCKLAYVATERLEDQRFLEMIRELDRRRLTAMVDYCKIAGCLREHVLRYFGQEALSACDGGAVP